jgi:L-asparaginase
MEKLKQILIIYTGGTIGMMHDPSTQTLIPYDFKNLSQKIPELKQFPCEIDFHSFKTPIDSSNVKPELWLELARLIEQSYSKYDGFVILHGTDTMAYTASAVSYLLDNLSKPVIFTGSQLPLDAIRTDAKRNLITTVEIVSGNVNVPEVCIYFSNQLYRGNRSEKYTSSKFDAFHSINYPQLAEAGSTIEYNHAAISKAPNFTFNILHSAFDTNVALIKIYPGIHPDVMNTTLQTKNLKAAIIETYGSGNAPTDKEFIDVLKKAIDKGIILLNISQCPGGRVEQGKYETSLHLKEIGVISGGDMTTEAAMTKLMFLLGQGLEKKEVEKLLQENLRGELTV